MSKKFETTRVFKINHSPLLLKWLIVIHIVALFAAVLNALAVYYKLAIIGSILISLTYYVKNINQCFFIRHGVMSGWEIAHSENHFYPVQISPSSVITAYIIILHFKKHNKKQSALICKDALMGDDYRALKVELKISGLSKNGL